VLLEECVLVTLLESTRPLGGGAGVTLVTLVEGHLAMFDEIFIVKWPDSSPENGCTLLNNEYLQQR